MGFYLTDSASRSCYPWYDLKETDSKVEQGNDNFNSERRQRQLHSNWELLNNVCYHIRRDIAAIAAAAAAAAVPW